MVGRSGRLVQLGWALVLATLLINYYVWVYTPPQYFISPVYWLSYVVWAIGGSYAILAERRVSPYDQKWSFHVGSPPMMYDLIFTGLLVTALTVTGLSRIFPELLIPFWGMVGICGGLAIHGSTILLRRLLHGSSRNG